MYNIGGKITTKMMPRFGLVWKEWLKDKQTKFGRFKNFEKKSAQLVW